MVMRIFVLIDVQYIQNVVFSFEKGSNGQNHSSSDLHQPIPPQQNFASSLPLKVISKTLDKWSALATAYFICKHLIEISSVSTGMNDYNNRIWPDSG